MSAALMSKHYKKSYQRQEIRTKQRGHLSRSTIFALIGVACLGLVVSQLHRLPVMSAAVKDNSIAWSAKQGFTVQNVNVTGRARVPNSFFINALKIERGAPILSYDVKSAQERLSENPWFKSVNVERRLPNTVFVSVEERQPVARWQVNNKLAVIDNEGVVLTTEKVEDYNTLPIIIGEDARFKIPDLFVLLNAEPSIGKDVSAATWVGGRRWDLTMKNDIVIKLPAKDPGLAMSKLAALMVREKVLERDLKTVDLRLENKAILQPTTRANAVIERPDFSDTPDSSKKNI